LSTYHRIITGGRPHLPAGSSQPEPPLTSKITISGWSTDVERHVNATICLVNGVIWARLR
jgi:hypothetical protein